LNRPFHVVGRLLSEEGGVVPPRRRLDDVRKPQILAAAVQLLVEEGLASVRVADVARRAGTSATSVIYYFGTKDALFEEAIAGADDAFYAALLADVERLDSGVDRLAWLVVSSSATDWLLWMDLWVYARRHPEMLAAHRRFDQRFRAMIADSIRHGHARGEWSAVEADAVALRLGSLMRGLAVHVALGEHEVTSERMVDQCLHAAALELGCEPAVLHAAAHRQAAAGNPPRPPAVEVAT
jgi:TetR/AcrR family transcriptional repressor of bet genes